MFALINIVGVEFLINFGGLGQLINDLAERYDLAGTYAAICFVILVSVVILRGAGKGRAMAETGQLRQAAAAAPMASPVTLLARGDHRRRAGGAGSSLAAFRPGCYRDVVPSLIAIAPRLATCCCTPISTAISALPRPKSARRSSIGGLSGLPSASRSAPTAFCRGPTSRFSTISGRRRRSSSSR